MWLKINIFLDNPRKNIQYSKFRKMLRILTKDRNKHDLSDKLIRNSILLSQLIRYPEGEGDLKIPFNLKTIKIAETFASHDSITAGYTFNPHEVFFDHIYTPKENKHQKIPSKLLRVLDKVSVEELTELINLGNYLNYTLLLECGCSRMANEMNGIGGIDDMIWSQIA